MRTVETVEDLQENWRDPYIQWYAAGMPSFSAVNKEPWKQLVIKFKTKEDRQHFGELYEYKLSDRTNAVWFPQKEREKNSENRYIEGDLE